MAGIATDGGAIRVGQVEDFIAASPDSVTWRVHGDRAMWLAGVRSLMLQALHPVAMRGVAQNSDYRTNPVHRLLRTADFVGVTTYGTPEAAEQFAARVRRIHRALRIRDPDGGPDRRVDEPELLRWVHCAEVASYLEVTTRAGLRLTRAQADRYLDEQRRTAALVGLPAGEVPGDVAGLRRYFASVRGELAVTGEAISAVRFLLWPDLPERLRALRPVKPLWCPVGALAYYLLPGWARAMYRILPEPPGGRSAATAALRGIRGALRSLPDPVYERLFSADSRAVLDGARQRLRAHGYDLSAGLRGAGAPPPT